MTRARLVLAWTAALLVGCNGGGDGGPGTGTSTETGTTAGTGAAASTGGSTSAPTTGDPTTGGAPARPYCGQACMVDSDCCFGTGTCPGPEYPKNVKCSADGVCEPPQCASDDDCSAGGTQPQRECHLVEAFSVCVTTCQSDQDCASLPGLTCSGVAESAQYCALPDVGTCTSDADCTYGTGDRCDVAGGMCYCEADSECTATVNGKCAGP